MATPARIAAIAQTPEDGYRVWLEAMDRQPWSQAGFSLWEFIRDWLPALPIAQSTWAARTPPLESPLLVTNELEGFVILKHRALGLSPKIEVTPPKTTWERLEEDD
jgi:hypothetical protein